MAQKVSINDRFHRVLSMAIPQVARHCYTNGFLGLLEGTCDPFRGPLGPRQPDGFGILGSRSDGIGNASNWATFFVRTKDISNVRNEQAG